MVSDFGSDLVSRSNYVVCDGTFNTTECKLVLTTILGFHEGIAIPCAIYYQTRRKQTTMSLFTGCVYLFFYFLLCLLFLDSKENDQEHHVSQGRALGFWGSTVGRICQGVSWCCGLGRLFPLCIYYTLLILLSFFLTLFLQVQANMKAIQKLGFKGRSKDVSEGIQSLWYAPTEKDFNDALREFLKIWDKEIPAYATYFRRNWLERYHPEKWASYARADNAPSGRLLLDIQLS